MVAQQPPDLILLDVMMPGMDGYEVAAGSRANPRPANIPDHHGHRAGRSQRADARARAPAPRTSSPSPSTAPSCACGCRNLLRLKAYGDYHDKYSQMLEGEVGSRTADLVESERLYRSTFDAAPVGIVHVGLDGQLAAGQSAPLRSARLLARGAAEPRRRRSCCSRTKSAGEAEAFRQMAAGTLDRHVDRREALSAARRQLRVGQGQHVRPSRRRRASRSTSSRSSRTSPNAGRSRRRSGRRARWTRSGSWPPASPTTSTTC